MMLEAFISMLRYLSSREDDDVADRLNYLYTPNMLLAFSVLISFKQFGGRPLECIFPSKFSSSLQEVIVLISLKIGVLFKLFAWLYKLIT
jgi:hypothetical protein